MRAWSRHVVVVQVVAVRRNERYVLDAGRVLPVRRFGRKQRTQRIAVCLRWLLPVRADGIPTVTQAFDVGVAILRDDGRYTLRMFDRHPQSRRYAVVEQRDDSVPIGQLWNQIAKHVTRRWEACSNSIAGPFTGPASR